jgi:rhodanese-related sulfurtransferase
MKIKLMALTGIFALLFAGQPVFAADIDVRQAAQLNQQGALLLDVREVDEYAEFHAPNAMLIPLGQLSERQSELVKFKDKSIVVVCRSGRRSAQAVHFLQQEGFTHVSNVNGGMMAWEQAGLAVMRKH